MILQLDPTGSSLRSGTLDLPGAVMSRRKHHEHRSFGVHVTLDFDVGKNTTAIELPHHYWLKRLCGLGSSVCIWRDSSWGQHAS